MKYLPLLYFIVFYSVAFVGRSLVVWRKTGINPYKLSASDDVAGMMSLYFRLLSLASFGVVSVYAFSDELYQYLGPIGWLQHPILVYLGIFLLLVALIWVVVAQIQMGNSWRIGIDSEHKTELVQTGVFKLSRNPIFLGMRVIYVGYFLFMPNAITLVLWVVGEALLQIQVRLEESHMKQQHSQDYQQYLQTVRRWL